MGKVSDKGQVTIPQEFREKFGIGPGSEVRFVEKNGDLVVEKEKTSFDDCEGKLGKRSTDDFMDKIRGSE